MVIKTQVYLALDYTALTIHSKLYVVVNIRKIQRLW